MKKLRNRVFIMTGIMVLAFTGLAGCKKTECWNCEKMKRCEPFEDYHLGMLNLCEECLNLIKPMSDRAAKAFGAEKTKCSECGKKRYCAPYNGDMLGEREICKECRARMDSKTE